jgi:hypothetical protein|tara:strand:+ start:46 stop:492 length:447 start_codon:yes stop_codon:yes gene_type:complete
MGTTNSIPQAAQVASQNDQLLASTIWVPPPVPGTAVLSPPQDERAEAERLLQVLESLGRSERVLEVLLSFIDQRCRLFTSEDEEQSLQCTAIHAEYCELFESILEDTLRRTGISATEFVRLLEKAVADGSEDAEALLRCVTGLRTEAA